MVRPRKSVTASDLTARERVVASRTDWQRVGIADETVTNMMMKGLVVRDALESDRPHVHRSQLGADDVAGPITLSADSRSTPITGPTPATGWYGRHGP